MPIDLEIVTIERIVFAGAVDMVTAPGTEGEMGILPNHAPLMTALTYGELRVKRGDEEQSFAIGGGFMEVLPQHVTVLANTAERADEIDLQRADAARRRAEQRMEARQEDLDYSRLEATLRRARTRIKVAEAMKKRRGRRGQPMPPSGTPGAS